MPYLDGMLWSEFGYKAFLRRSYPTDFLVVAVSHRFHVRQYMDGAQNSCVFLLEFVKRNHKCVYINNVFSFNFVLQLVSHLHMCEHITYGLLLVQALLLSWKTNEHRKEGQRDLCEPLRRTLSVQIGTLSLKFKCKG